jgi:hypothetical protein
MLPKSRTGRLINWSYEASITLILKQDTDITGNKQQTTSLKNFLNLQQNTIKPNPATHKKDYTHDQMGFIPGKQG